MTKTNKTKKEFFEKFGFTSGNKKTWYLNDKEVWEWIEKQITKTKEEVIEEVIVELKKIKKETWHYNVAKNLAIDRAIKVLKSKL